MVYPLKYVLVVFILVFGAVVMAGLVLTIIGMGN
jgi:uncharacterized membrane protein YdfJ with MMPL/SSD domain